MDSPWHKDGKDMYKVDKYARERVIRSVRLLLPYLKDGDTILDVGCFTQEAKKYLPWSVNYTGIDEKAYHPTTKVVDFRCGFEPIVCSHALCLETLEHLQSPKETLESIYHSLPSEGKLVVSLPNECTIFHRLRCLFGIVDAQCWDSGGKHLHLPSLKQSVKFLSHQFELERLLYYISTSANNSQQAWIGGILKLIPDTIWQFLANRFPSLFARGFIFLLKKKPVQVS